MCSQCLHDDLVLTHTLYLGADNETEVAEAAVVDSTEQGETLPETALPEDGVHASHQTSATPEVLEKHEDQGGVTTSQDDQTESE